MIRKDTLNIYISNKLTRNIINKQPFDIIDKADAIPQERRSMASAYNHIGTIAGQNSLRYMARIFFQRAYAS